MAYVSPFNNRYGSKAMREIFSEERKFITWRKLWVALAETEKELGLKINNKPIITDEMIDELKEHVADLNLEVAEQKEKEIRHDVMAHIYAYAEQCPKAAGIIHLGATSCYVKDNADLIIMRDALLLIRKKIINVIALLADFAEKYQDLPTLAFTHLQPAQPTTVGKRATLWLQDFYSDVLDLDYVLSSLKLLGSKGTTGTQASFKQLFDNDLEKVEQIDLLIAQKMGFKSCYDVSGQTYSRKVDTRIINVLAGIASSAMKFSNDLRFLQSLKEIEEPFEEAQVGSSAMAYKRNPMRAERIASLSRYVMVDTLNASFNASSQFLERTLDDSANRRLAISEAFLATDSILDLCINVSNGLKVNEKIIKKHLDEELPFMATENIMMEAVKKGGNRQKIHEEIRKLSMEAAQNVKEKGLENNLIDLLINSKVLNLSEKEIKETINSYNFIGYADKQTTSYLNNIIKPFVKENQDSLGLKEEINL